MVHLPTWKPGNFKLSIAISCTKKASLPNANPVYCRLFLVAFTTKHESADRQQGRFHFWCNYSVKCEMWYMTPHNYQNMGVFWGRNRLFNYVPLACSVPDTQEQLACSVPDTQEQLFMFFHFSVANSLQDFHASFTKHFEESYSSSKKHN